VSVVRSVYSLRRRLVLLLIGVVALLWSVSALVAFRTAHAEADELFDAQLVQVAETLLAIVAASEDGHVADEMAEHQHAYQLPIAFQAWQRETDGRWRLLVRSSEMPALPATGGPGFDEHDLHGELWRFFTVDHDHSDYRVIVGHNHGARYRLAGEIALHLLLPILIGLPLMALGIWAVVGRALRPVDAVAQAVGGRGLDVTIEIQHEYPRLLRTVFLGLLGVLGLGLALDFQAVFVQHRLLQTLAQALIDVIELVHLQLTMTLAAAFTAQRRDHHQDHDNRHHHGHGPEQKPCVLGKKLHTSLLQFYRYGHTLA